MRKSTKSVKAPKGKKPAVKRQTLAPVNKVIKLKRPSKKLREHEALGELEVADTEQTLGFQKSDFEKPNGNLDASVNTKSSFWEQLKYYFGLLKP